MTAVTRDGQLDGLAAMIADLVEANLIANPSRSKLLVGRDRHVRITASDLDTDVGLHLGGGRVRITQEIPRRPQLWILTDSATLLDLPNAKVLAGLPSIVDETGRKIAMKILLGHLKVRGIFRLPLLSKVQRLLSVA
jgi:hypothetical protein